MSSVFSDEGAQKFKNTTLGKVKFPLPHKLEKQFIPCLVAGILNEAVVCVLAADAITVFQ
jgi:hypothetical protein